MTYVPTYERKAIPLYYNCEKAILHIEYLVEIEENCGEVEWTEKRRYIEILSTGEEITDFDATLISYDPCIERDPEIVCVSNDGGETIIQAYIDFNIQGDPSTPTLYDFNGNELSGYEVVSCDLDDTDYEIHTRHLCNDDGQWAILDLINTETLAVDGVIYYNPQGQIASDPWDLTQCETEDILEDYKTTCSPYGDVRFVFQYNSNTGVIEKIGLEWDAVAGHTVAVDIRDNNSELATIAPPILPTSSPQASIPNLPLIQNLPVEDASTGNEYRHMTNAYIKYTIDGTQEIWFFLHETAMLEGEPTSQSQVSLDQWATWIELNAEYDYIDVSHLSVFGLEGADALRVTNCNDKRRDDLLLLIQKDFANNVAGIRDINEKLKTINDTEDKELTVERQRTSWYTNIPTPYKMLSITSFSDDVTINSQAIPDKFTETIGTSHGEVIMSPTTIEGTDYFYTLMK